MRELFPTHLAADLAETERNHYERRQPAKQRKTDSRDGSRIQTTPRAIDLSGGDESAITQLGPSPDGLRVQEHDSRRHGRKGDGAVDHGGPNKPSLLLWRESREYNETV